MMVIMHEDATAKRGRPRRGTHRERSAPTRTSPRAMWSPSSASSATARSSPDCRWRPSREWTRVVAILRPVQAGQPRVPGRRHGHRRGRRQDRRRPLRPHSRSLLGGDAGPGALGRPGRQGGRRHDDARRRLQAAHLTLCVPGAGGRGPGDPGRSPGRDRAAGGHRAHGPARPRRRGRYADVIQIGARNMQNFQLLAAVGQAGKPVLLKRGPVGDHRGAPRWRPSTSSRRATTT